MLHTNVFGALRTLHASLPALKDSKGRFVVIGSVLSHISLPGSTPYAMSKFALRAFAEGAWAELRTYGISVTHVSPGYVDTEIHRVDNLGTFQADKHDPLPHWIPISPDAAAKKILRAAASRKKEVTITTHAKVLIAFNRLFPGALTRLMAFLMDLRKRRLSQASGFRG